MWLNVQAKMPISISPSRDFSVLIFAFDGVPSASVLDPIHYLNVQPQNYLEWHVRSHALNHHK